MRRMTQGFSIAISIYAGYFFFKCLVLFVQRLFDSNPYSLDNFEMIRVVTPSLEIAFFSMSFFVLLLSSILFLVLIISLWKNYNWGICLGVIPLMLNVYLSLANIHNGIKYVDEFVYSAFNALFSLISIIFLVFILIKKPD